MNKFTGLYDVRDYQPTDKNFIMSTFLKGLYYGDSWFSQVPKQIFMTSYQPFLEKLLDKPTVTVKVACLKEDSEVILGYSILSADFQTIHWVYVKTAWRLKGLATNLTPNMPTQVTHLTQVGKELLPKFKTAVFNPFAV